MPTRMDSVRPVAPLAHDAHTFAPTGAGSTVGCRLVGLQWLLHQLHTTRHGEASSGQVCSVTARMISC